MPWGYKTVWHFPTNGPPYSAQEPYWIPEAAPKAAVSSLDPKAEANAALAERRAMAAKKTAAAAKAGAALGAAAAAAAARARAQENARKALYASLAAYSKGIRSLLAPPTTSKKPTVLMDPKAEANANLAERRAYAAAQAKAYVPKPGEMTPAEEMRLEKLYAHNREAGLAAIKADQKRRADIAAVAALKANPDDKKSVTAVEMILKESRTKASSGGAALDPKFVSDATEAYYAHAKKITDQFQSNVNKLNKYLVMGKDGKFRYASKSARDNYFKLYNSKDFAAQKAEVQRLYGVDQRKPKYVGVDGKAESEFAHAMGAYDITAKAQRQYVRDAAKAAFTAGATGREDYLAKVQKWNDTESFKYLLDAGDIQPGETSMVWENGKMRHRTPKEEFAFRKTQYNAEISRRAKTMEEENKRRALLLSDPKYEAQQNLAERNALYPQYAGKTPAEARNLDLMVAAEKVMNPSGNKEFLKDHNNMDKTVDQAMRAWEADNKRLYQSAAGKAGGRGTSDGMTHGDAIKWRVASDAQRKRFYETIGMNAPSFVDKIAGSPISAVMRPVLAGVGGFASAIGGLARVGNLLVGGDGTFEMPVNGGDLPPEIRKMIDKASNDVWVAGRGKGMQNVNGQMMTAEGAANAAGTKAMKDWLASPEGKAWRTKFEADRRGNSIAQTQKFYNGFYGQSVPDSVKSAQDAAAKKAIEEARKNLPLASRMPIPRAKIEADARKAEMDKWLKTPEGQKWKDAGGSGGDLWDRLNALSEFGSQPTSNMLLNTAIGAVTDPTIAMPLKPTTWAARFAHAAEATAEMNRLQRVYKGAIAFQHVTEPELRAEKAMRWIADEVKAAGGDGRLVEARLRAELAGITDVSERGQAIKDYLKKIGVNPESTNGTLILNAAQDNIVKYLKEKGVNYEGLVKNAKEAEAAHVAEEAAARAAKPTTADIVDIASKARDEKAIAADTAKREALAVEKAGELKGLQAELHAAIEAPPPLEIKVHEAPGTQTAAVLEMRAKDPLRAETPISVAIREEQEAGVGVRTAQWHSGEVRVPDAAERTATMAQAISGGRDTVQILEHDFAPGPYTDNFVASQEFRDIKSVLSIPEPTPVRVPDAVAKADYLSVMEERAKARADLLQASKESQAIALRDLQSTGRTGAPLEKGVIPFRKTSWGGVVEGGRESGEQYITSSEALHLASGDINEAGQITTTELRRAVESVQQRLTTAYKRYKSGSLTHEQWLEITDDVRVMGVYRRHGDIAIDLANGDGMLVSVRSGQLDHVRAGIADFIPVGDAMVEDFMPTGQLSHYYDTLSMLPEMMRGPGYETDLMNNIMVPQWRAQLSAKRFQSIMVDSFLMDRAALPSPGEFRAQMSHLFALFHLTALDSDTALAQIADLRVLHQQRKISSDELMAGIRKAHADSNGSIDLLHEYSMVMDTILEADPANIYARAWKVMESRSGVWWAEPFATSEGLFVDTVLTYGHRLHPNLALQMIPYGPIARTLPIAHGFVNHMRNFASTLSGLFKASPTRWDDNVVVDLMGTLANPRVPVQERITLSSQIAHYVASRYGNSLRRARFGIVLHDYAIEATGAFRTRSVLGEEQYQSLRRAWVETELVRNPKTLREDATAQFDRFFTQAPRKGLKRRTFDDAIRDAYLERYWKNEVTHDNPALHTSMFFEKMGDPNMARGDTWLKYANSYWDHMVTAGAEGEAKEVIRTMFEQRIHQEARTSIDLMRAGVKGSTIRGGVSEFFARSGVLGDLRKVFDASELKAGAEEHVAQLESEAEVMRNNFLIEDDALREQQRKFAAGATTGRESSAMYDMATVENIVDAAVLVKDEALAADVAISRLSTGATQMDEALARLARADEAVARFSKETRAVQAPHILEQDAALAEARKLARRAKAEAKAADDVANGVPGAQAKLDRLKVGEHKLSPSRKVQEGVARPSEGRMKGYHQKYKEVLRTKGPGQAEKYLRGIPEDGAAWVRAELRQRAAQQRMYKLLDITVHRTVDMGSIPIHVGEQMADLVAVIKTMPGGDGVLKGFADVYYQDLIRTRLIDYLKNEPWFEWRGQAVGTESVVTDMTKQMTEMTGKISDLSEKLRGAKEADKAPIQAQLDELTATREAVRGERDDLIAKRPEGALGGKPATALPTPEEITAATPRPVGPSPYELNSPRIAAAQQALDILGQMNEKQWLARELHKAQLLLKTTEGAEKAQAISRIRDIRKANRVIEYAENGANGPYIKGKSRATYAKGVVSTVGDRAKAVFAPKRITAYVHSHAGLDVEQGRSYYALLGNSTVNSQMQSNVRRVGEVSETYAKHGAAIEAKFALKIKSDLLRRNGFPPEILSELDTTMFLTNYDEFLRASQDPRWRNFMRQFSDKADAEIRLMSKDKNYGLERWLDDRLVQRGEYFDSRRFDEVEQQVSDAIAAERQGRKKQTLTDLVRPQGTKDFTPLAEAVETDVHAVVAKARVLSQLGIDPHAYNEARRVLRTPLIQKRTGAYILAGAEQAARDALHARGMVESDIRWADEFAKVRKQEFLARREKMAEQESVKLLDQLAREMHGALHNDVAAEFERRYGAGFDVTGGGSNPITPFQKRTLEEAVKTHLGVENLDDVAEMQVALTKHGQAPDFTNRARAVEWLKEYGFWSPRTADVIRDTGSKSWDIFTEDKYWRDHFGAAPEWADSSLLEEGGELHYLLHDEAERGWQFREWGLFDSNTGARFEKGEMTRAERARLRVEGNEELGLKPQRDLPAERQYVIDRYGRLAADPSGNLIAFPELMNADELRNYVSTQSGKSFYPEDVFRTVEEQEVFNQVLDQRVRTLVDSKYLAGETVEWGDVFEMSSQVAHDMLLNPIWSTRSRDTFGKALRGSSAARRALIMAQPAFAGTNIVDTAIKGGWGRFTSRAFYSTTVSEAARAIDARGFGFSKYGQLLHDVENAGTDRARLTREGSGGRYYIRTDGTVTRETAREKAASDAIQYAVAATELPGQLATKAENTMKLRMAQGMYDEVYARFLDRFGDEALADAGARKFIKNEVDRLWPTAGDTPLEQLFSQVFPFAQYQVKNHLLWIGELASHPAVYNYFNRIGDLIEAYNRSEWEKRGETGKYSDVEARRIELPWAHGVFIDFGNMSDAGAGLKPFYDLASGKATVESLASQFVRLASANEVNAARGIMNAFDFGQSEQWVQGRDKNGFPNGVWTRVKVPWEAPWGGEANIWNSIFGVELVSTAYTASLDGKFSAQELSVLAYQSLFFGAPKLKDKGARLNSFYFALKDKDPKAAEEWLAKTADGAALRTYWTEKPDNPQEWNPQSLHDALWPKPQDKNPWFHTQSADFQAQVKQGLDDLHNIQDKWSAALWEMTPGTKEFAEAKLNANNERFAYIASHPWMYDYYAFKMTPQEWAAEQDEWTVDDSVNSFFNIEFPKRGVNESDEAYRRRLQLWKKTRDDFLAANPKVVERLAKSRTSVEAVWKATESHWFDVLDRIGTRSVAIRAAKASKNFALVDQLYLANDLDYMTLNTDTAVSYFNPSTDFNPLAKDVQGPLTLRGLGGENFIKRMKILPGFDQWRYNKMDDAGKAEYKRNADYADGMKGIIAQSKASSNFGATFVRLLKANPKLMAEYFRRNPGKREKWASNDAYIGLISKYGLLAKAGKFSEAGKYFDNLPDWVKSRYYDKHPEKRARLQQNLQYMGYMKRWTDFYRRRDYEGGAAFFDKLPKWVQDRYQTGHPEGFSAKGSSPYSKAMGKWVGLLQSGDKDAAKAYFDTLPKAFKDRYYAGHPEAKLRDDIKHTGMLGVYFGADDANRAQYLKDNPDFAKWLKSQGDSAQTRRMLITAAYRALPKDDAWMRRVFREKYPEVFSKEAAGQRAIANVVKSLSEHPEMTVSFQKWLEAVLASYAEELKHVKSQPKPLTAVHQRQHGSLDKRRPHGPKSAAWVRLHSAS